MPLLEISLTTARGMLTVAAILAGISLVLLIISVFVFVAARAWYRAAKGELTVPPEDDLPPEDAIPFDL